MLIVDCCIYKERGPVNLNESFYNSWSPITGVRNRLRIMILVPMGDISRRLALFVGVGLRTSPVATVPSTYAIV